MKILSINDPAFRKYGRVITNVDLSGLVETLKTTPLPEGVEYQPSVAELEALPVMAELSRISYGEMPIQIGYCNGHNSKLNALEYHRDSELNIAATDAVLLLGLLADVEEDFTYDTSKVEAFLLPAGCGVEIFATSMHYAPCALDGKGFQVAIVLPKGTNYDLQGAHAKVTDGKADNEDALLTAVNKWLIGHSEGGLDEGAFLGLKGKNLDVNE